MGTSTEAQRRMRVRGIHHLAVHTTDLDRLRTFYEQAFGFEAVGDEANTKDFPEASLVMGVENAVARALMMRAGNCYVELFEWIEPKGRPAQPLAPNDPGYTHFCVDVTNIEEEYERLAALGMTFAHPSPVRSGNTASVYGRDPDGNIIEILEAPPGDSVHLDVGA